MPPWARPGAPSNAGPRVELGDRLLAVAANVDADAHRVGLAGDDALGEVAHGCAIGGRPLPQAPLHHLDGAAARGLGFHACGGRVGQLGDPHQQGSVRLVTHHGVAETPQRRGRLLARTIQVHRHVAHRPAPGSGRRWGNHW